MSHTLTSAPLRSAKESIEDIVLRHSGRGMNILQHYLDAHYCRNAAQQILSLPKGTILLTTGFYVAGHAETDGPLGTIALAKALKQLGYTPVIITDLICNGLFEPENLTVEYVSFEADEKEYSVLLQKYAPVCLISIERCGHNLENDYANMRGISIAAQTASIDKMFELALASSILTIGIGDGGNEIGMGNLKDVISEKLSLVPCTVSVNTLIIATTSNWGAYALVAYLALLTQSDLFPTYKTIADCLTRIVSMGCVDGVTKKPENSVDGFPSNVEQEIVEALLYVSSIGAA